MNRPLQILLVEDDFMDALFINHLLLKSGLQFASKRVDTEEEFLSELQQNPPDVILSDHGLPSFAGTAALAIARKKCPGTPFVFVTGRPEQGFAIKAFSEGVAACIPKDHIADLPPLLHRFARDADKSWFSRTFGGLIARFKSLFTRHHRPSEV